MTILSGQAQHVAARNRVSRRLRIAAKEDSGVIGPRQFLHRMCVRRRGRRGHQLSDAALKRLQVGLLFVVQQTLNRLLGNDGKAAGSIEPLSNLLIRPRR